MFLSFNTGSNERAAIPNYNEMLLKAGNVLVVWGGRGWLREAQRMMVLLLAKVFVLSDT